jgi:hypothetical protein
MSLRRAQAIEPLGVTRTGGLAAAGALLTRPLPAAPAGRSDHARGIYAIGAARRGGLATRCKFEFAPRPKVNTRIGHVSLPILALSLNSA